MFDSHCHLTFPEFRGRLDAIMASARSAGVYGAITVSTSTSDAVRSLELAKTHSDLWCTAGVHPLHSDEPIAWDEMRRCGLDAKCVAWGELGLDNHYDRPPQAQQRSVLDAQLAVICDWRRQGIEKPIVIHCREAFDDLVPVLAATGLPADRFVFHCFTGTADEARRVLDFGAWISFTGVVTFRNAKSVAEAAQLVPRDRMMVETDAPFLTPDPLRTVRPNEPRYIPHIVQRLAELRREESAACAEQLDLNTERFFGLSIRRS
ncbi:MAG: TatD family hydrolase [Phycisphaerae bacterium]|nr:TatD family hydrolase [Phycisphaerae bacterium]